MPEALLILNAGSSSIKLSIFDDGDPPQLILRGQLEELMICPRFSAQDAVGRVIGAYEWEVGTVLGHQKAIEFLFGWGRRGALREHRIVAGIA